MSTTGNSPFLCPHCGNKNTYTIESKVPSGYVEGTHEDEHFIRTMYFLVKCSACNDVSLFIKTDFYHDGELDDFFDCHQLYPVERPIHDVPKQVRQAYTEARRVEKISKVAFVSMMRRALESLCDEQGAEGKDLYHKLNDLVAKGIIPHKLGDLGQAIRSVGKHGAHATNYELEDYEVRAIKDFFLTMVEYVYVAPAKLESLKKTMGSKQKPNNP